MERWFLRNRICEVIEYIGTLIFIALSASSISSSPAQAAFFTFITYLFIGIMRSVQFDDTTPRKVKIKKLLLSVIPSAIVLIIALVLENNSDKYNKEFFETALYITVAVLLGLIVLDFTYYGVKDRNTMGRNLMKYKKISHTQKIIYNVSYYLCRFLVILGLALEVIGRSEWNSAVNIGCIIWLFNKIVWMYCWYKCDNIVDVNECGEVSADTSLNASGTNVNNERQLTDREIDLLVKEIAYRWTGREDSSSFLPGGGSIRYSVSVEVSGGNRIDYTINGRLMCVKDEYLSEAHSLLGFQMDKAAMKIAEETKKELSKHNLPSSYDINVRKGYIE